MFDSADVPSIKECLQKLSLGGIMLIYLELLGSCLVNQTKYSHFFDYHVK